MKKTEPKWKLIEEVVSVIEKEISPESRVEHDVWLPDLTESSKKRQCDIVIRSGKPPRETITIVEVQNRSKKFDITLFDGLCTKMRKVGAQHLICVSRKGFPESIKKEAIKQGPTVRLVTLEDLHERDWPVNILENCIFISERNILEIQNSRLGVKKGCLPSSRGEENSSLEPIFEYEGYSKRISINDLINIHTNETESKKRRLLNGIITEKFHFPEEGKRLWHVDSKTKTEIVTLDFAARIEIRRTKIPLTCLSYKQIGAPFSLAWLMETTCIYQGQELEIHMTLFPRDDGNYRMKISKIPPQFKEFSIFAI